jgi:hypothetical protein
MIKDKKEKKERKKAHYGGEKKQIEIDQSLLSLHFCKAKTKSILRNHQYSKFWKDLCLFLCISEGKASEGRPASLGTALQQHWPLERMKLMSFLSSSAVHGPFFNPTLSQHGCLPILTHPKLKHPIYCFFRRENGRQK